MFCPKCKSEYRSGFVHCQDCDVDLVEQLPQSPHLDEGVPPSVVFITADAIEANLIQSLLEGSGIEAMLIDENFSRMDSPAALAIGGVKIVVPKSQEELANEVLAEYRGSAGQDPKYGYATPFHVAPPDDFDSGENE